MDKRLGYYICGGVEFESKIAACIYGTQHNLPVTWNFNKEFFDKYNWTVEPTETLDQLYDRRARQLREKYDYLVVSYSGGADSHNLLMSFIRQNLHVDEIVVNTMEKADTNFKNVNVNNKSASVAPSSEHVLQTIPRLKEIANLIPNTKINVLDLSDYLFTSFKSAGDASWVVNKKEKLNPINLTRFNYIYYSDLRKRFDKDKKIAVIMGVEKPRVYIHNGTKELFLRFTDGAANLVSVVAEHLSEYPNSVIEYFYWSPDAADIICKQAHVIKHWLNAFPQNKPMWGGKALTYDVYRLVHERVYRNLLYTTWDSNWYQADKAIMDWYTEFDNWFFEQYKDTDHYQIWKEGLNYVTYNAHHFLKYNKNEDVDGLQMFTQEYKFGTIDP